MPRVGRFVTDPRAGAYGQITLDSGEKVMVNHDKGGFSSDRIWACDLDSPAGQEARVVDQGRRARAGTLGELRTRCAALMASR